MPTPLLLAGILGAATLMVLGAIGLFVLFMIIVAPFELDED
jgi:hypothetical protein